MKKADLYARVSTELQKGSIADQFKRLLSYCEEYDIDVVKTFEDCGSGGNPDRKGFNDLKDYVKNEVNITFIIFTEHSRISRNEYTASDMLHQLLPYGVFPVAIDSKNSDSTHNFFIKNSES